MSEIIISKNEQKRIKKAAEKAKLAASKPAVLQKEEDMDATQYREFRISNISTLRKNGLEPFPESFNDELSLETFVSRHSNIEKGTHMEKLVSVSGRVLAKRESGSKLVFFDIIAGNVKLQVLANANFYESVEKYKEMVTNTKRGDIIGVLGHPGKSNLGEISIIPKKITLLVPCMRQLPHSHYGLKDQETRYRNRSLDMIMNPEVIDPIITIPIVEHYIRSFLKNLSFKEVKTPMMQSIPGGATAKPFVTHYKMFNRNMFLRISPELCLKKLIIGGMPRVFEIGPQFRNESADLTHNPEFSTCEFYMKYADYNDLLTITESMVSGLVYQLFGKYTFNYTKNGKEIEVDCTPPFKRIDMMSGLEDYLKVSLPKPTDLGTEAARAALDKICVERNVDCSAPRTTARLLDKLVGEYLESQCINPTYIINHPEIMSPLAKGHRSIPGLTERFELFVLTKELANAYTELNDPLIQRERFQQQAKDKDAGDDEAMFVDESYLRDMEYALAPTAGWGLGIDRLAMFLTNKESIRDVIAFPAMKPEQKKPETETCKMPENGANKNGEEKREAAPNTEMVEAVPTVVHKEDREEAVQYVKSRIAAGHALAEKGVTLFPHKFHVSMAADAFVSRCENIEKGAHLDELVSVAGRVVAKREEGNLVYFDLMEDGTTFQIEVNRDRCDSTGHFEEVLSFLRRGDIIGVSGLPAKSESGEALMLAKSITLLAPCLRKLCDSEFSLADPETRYDNRVLDMILNPPVIDRFNKVPIIEDYIRTYLKNQSFTEVKTPMLHTVSGGANAVPFVTYYNDYNMNTNLRVSPELYLKQMVIGGLLRIFEIGRQFRTEHVDSTHNPEFSTLDFYVTNADQNDLMGLIESMISGLVFQLNGKYSFCYTKNDRDIEVDCTAPFKRIDLMSGLEDVLKVSLPKPTELDTEEARKTLDQICVDRNIECAAPRTSYRLLDRLAKECLVSQCVNPVFITDYPEIMCPLAKWNASTVGLTNQFQLAVMNIELGKGSTELNDAIRQREKFQQQATNRAAGDNEAMVIDESYMDALELGLQPTAGLRLGLDRLSMLLTNAQSIQEILIFPFIKL